MDAFIQFNKLDDSIIEAELIEQTGNSILETKLKIDLENKTISNYKDFFVELVEQSFLNDVKYDIDINDGKIFLKEDYEKIKSFLLESISSYNDVNV